MSKATVGRPRDEAVSAALLEATRDLLAQEGFAGLTVDAIAARAGTGKPAVYRRWASKEDLVVAAIAGALTESIRVPDTGSLHDDLVLLNRSFHESLSTRTGRITRALVAEAVRDERWRAVLTEGQRANRRRTSVIIRRAVERGELSPDVDGDLVIDLTAGPLWSHALIWHDLSQRQPDIEAIVGMVLAGCAAQQKKARRAR